MGWFADWVADARWAANMKRARKFRRSLTPRQRIAFDIVYNKYEYLNLPAQTHFDGYMKAMEAALKVEP